MNKLTHRFRFFWRRPDATKWNMVHIKTAGPQYAHLGMQSHITHKLKKQLADVVVDHLFFQVDDNDEVTDQFSLNDREHLLQMLFANRIWNPGAKPQQSHE